MTKDFVTVGETVGKSSFFSDYRQLVCHEHGEYLAAKFTLSGETRVTGCPACIAIKQEQQTRETIKTMNRENQLATIRAVINRAAIPPSFADCTFDNYQIYAGEAQALVVNNLRYFAENFTQAQQKNIHGILTGTTGTGKTHLAAATINELIKRGYTAVFATMSDIINTIRSTFTNKTQSKQSVIQRFIDIDLLIIDEAAVTDSDSERSEIFHIINKRYELKHPTLLITNVIDELKTKLGQRVVSRLQQGKFVQIFNWADYRLKDHNVSGGKR